MSSQVDSLKIAYAAIAVGDVPTVLSMMDDQIEWTEAEGFPYHGTYHGHDEVVQNVFARLVTEWDRFTVTPNEYIDAGDTVVALGRYSATWPPTEKSFECDFAHVWEFRNGKAVRFRQYVDSALVQEAMRE
jgi:uncharacterized protein